MSDQSDTQLDRLVFTSEDAQKKMSADPVGWADIVAQMLEYWGSKVMPVATEEAAPPGGEVTRAEFDALKRAQQDDAGRLFQDLEALSEIMLREQKEHSEDIKKLSADMAKLTLDVRALQSKAHEPYENEPEPGHVGFNGPIDFGEGPRVQSARVEQRINELEGAVANMIQSTAQVRESATLAHSRLNLLVDKRA